MSCTIIQIDDRIESQREKQNNEEMGSHLNVQSYQRRRCRHTTKEEREKVHKNRVNSRLYRSMNEIIENAWGNGTSKSA